MATSRYTYLFADLLTNLILDELPMQEVEFTAMLNGAGDFQGYIPIADNKVAKRDWLTSTQPGRTALYVDRNGILVWGGIVWDRKYTSDDLRLEIDATEFWSYFRRRRITAGCAYEGLDQLTIAASLINTAQAAASGNIGVIVNPAGITTPIMRDCVYYSYERKPVAEAVEEMANLEDGFDFAIDVAWGSDGTPQKIWNPGYPRRGVNPLTTGAFFELPGNIKDYEWDDDATSLATSLAVIGAGEGDDLPTQMLTATDALDTGFPLLEDEISYADTTDPVLLASRNQTEQDLMKAAVVVPTLDVRADLDPELGSYLVGDDIRLRITDPRFPATLDTFQRVTAIQVTPQDDGEDEYVTLTLMEAI